MTVTTTTFLSRETPPPGARQRPRFRGYTDPDYYRDPRNASIAMVVRMGPDAEYMTRADYQNQEILAQASAIGRDVRTSMEQVLSGSPTVTPGIAVALSMLGLTGAEVGAMVPDDIRDRILALDSTAAGMDPTRPDIDRHPRPGSAVERSGGLMRLVKAIARPAFAALSAPQEAVIGGIRGVVGALTDEEGPDWGQAAWQLGGILPPIAAIGEATESYEKPNPWEQTLGGQMIIDRFDESERFRETFNIEQGTPGVDLGSGFFVGGRVATQQAQAARAAAPMVGGHAWTLGRGFASLLYEDTDSLAFKNISGIVDLAAVLLLDPTVIGSKATRVGQGLRQGARIRALTSLADDATEAALSRQVARLVDDTGTHVRDVITLHSDTAKLAREAVADAQKTAARSHAEMLRHVDPRQRASLEVRRDELLDAADLARADLKRAGEQVVAAGGSVTEGGRFRVGQAALPDPELRAGIDEVSMAVGDEVLDSLMARVTGLAPDLPGQFTDAVFDATKRKAARPNLLPGSVDGRDGLISWTSPKQPNLVSVDDPISNVDEILTAFKGSLGRRSNQRKRDISDLTDLLTDPAASWGDLINASLDRNLGTVLYRALLDTDIDGITDVFRLRGGENGVWWTTRAAEGMPWARAGWERAVGLREDAMTRLRETRKGLTSVNRDLAELARKENAYRKVADLHADTVARGVDNLTSLGDEEVVLRNVLEYGFGVVREPGRSPKVDYDLIQAALFGDTNRVDDLIGAGAQIGARARAGEAFGRSTLALATLGVSEVGRAASKAYRGKVIIPARQRVLQALVDAGPNDVARIQRFTRGKLDNDTLVSLAAATSTDEVLEVLAPRLGLLMGTPLTGNPLGAGRMSAASVTARGSNTIWQRATDWVNKASAIQPRAFTHLNYADPTGSTQMLRNYLTATGMPVEQVDSALNPYILAQTEAGRARAAMNAFNRLAKHLSVEHNQRFDEATREVLDDALVKATRLYQGGMAEVNNWWRPRYAHDANLGFMTTDGRRIELPGPQLEAELARGGTVLPDPMAIRAAYGRWGAFLTKHPNAARARSYAEAGMDIWRTAVLARLAYIWRNIGEMQIRMQLSGHQTLFSHPINHIALAWSMNPRAGAFRRTAGGFARYNRTAYGGKFTVPKGGDIDNYEAALDDFADLMTHHGSFHDIRTYNSAAMTGAVRPVRVDQPEFTSGWADQLMMLHSSRIARIVAGEDPAAVAEAVARGVGRKEAVIAWLTQHSDAAQIRRTLAESGDAFTQILADPRALREYLFDGPYSVAARINEMTGSIPELHTFVRSGRLHGGSDSRLLFEYRTHGDPALREAAMAARTGRLSGALTAGRFKQRLPNDYKIVARVNVGGPKTATTRLGNWFFNWAGSLERAHAVGPEFAFTYWDTLADLVPAMTKATRAKILAEARRQSGLLGRNNINLVKIRKGMTAEEGSLILDDVHAVASKMASQQIEKLFYDAGRRQQVWHATRLALPFAQATYNTLTTWGRLMATKPVQAYTVGRALFAAQEPGASVIYDNFEALDPFGGTYDHDPNQGFLYRDPEDDELKFKFPLAGSALGAVLAPFIGYNLPEAQTLTATASSLNLALQGQIDFLPGAGPLVSLPASVIMPDDWYGAVPDTLRAWLFPFGEPQTEAGIVESQLPAWARRFVLGTFFNEDYRAYAYKGAMAYVASSREWPGLFADPMVTRQYLEEVERVAKAMTAIRGIGTFVLPSAPLQDIYAQDKDGTLISVTMLGSYWRQIQDAIPGDFERQVETFMEMFGEDAVFGIIPTSKGERSITTPGWEFQKAHSAEARAHSKVLGVFFPGDFSSEASDWMRRADKRERLSPSEREAEARRYIYAARVAAIERNAALYEWDADTLNEAKDTLREVEFGGVTPPYSGGAAATLDEVRQALRTAPNLAATRGGQAAELMFEAYDEYTEASERRYGVGLAGKKATPLRERFLAEVNTIASQYPLLSGRENEGAADLIAIMFVNAVQPRS